VLDFGALPPEINSARIYSGPGSAPMVAAASAWNGLAAELNSAATSYDQVITQLSSEEWLGSASTSVADAAAPYVTWMSSTAGQAEQAATQARAAAAAYENALTASVPPAEVAANRTQLQSLVATNVLGQNTPAIAANQAQYGEMWAQDAAAMYQYAAQSAAAANVTPFASPAATTNPVGQALQAAAVTNATATSSATSVQSVLSDLNTALQNALQTLQNPLGTLTSSTTDPLGAGWLNLLGLGSTTSSTSLIGSITSGAGTSGAGLTPTGAINAFKNFIGPAYNTLGLPYFATGMSNSLLELSKGLAPAAAKAAEGGAGAAKAAGGLPGLGAALGGGGLGGAGRGVSAGLGGAAPVGGLSVPPSWAAATPAMHPASATPLPISSISAGPESSPAGNLLGGMPLAGAAAGGGGSGPRYGFKPTVMMRPPFAG
jgi:PPE-repeat protein